MRVRYGPFKVLEIFLIHNDGRLILYETVDPKLKLDKDAVGGMLTAIQDFIESAFWGEGAREGIQELQYRKFRILIEHGIQLFIAVACMGKASLLFRRRMRKVLRRIDKRYSAVLEEWDGDPDRFEGVELLLKPLIPLLSRLQRHRAAAKAEVGEGEMGEDEMGGMEIKERLPSSQPQHAFIYLQPTSPYAYVSGRVATGASPKTDLVACYPPHIHLRQLRQPRVRARPVRRRRRSL
jgi:hypothetical protein